MSISLPQHSDRRRQVGLWPFKAAVALLSALALMPAATRAQEPGTPPGAAAAGGPATPAPVRPVGTDPRSPRACLQSYLDLCRAGRFGEAAAFLDLSGPATGLDGPMTARRLKAVLDRHLWFDMERISPEADGALDDGLPPALERLGQMAIGGGEAPVMMARAGAGQSPAWRFAAETVAAVDGWYAGLGSHRLRDRVPALLLRPGPLELQWWQWLALPALVLLCWAGARLIGWLARPLAARLAGRSRNPLDDLLLERLFGPALLLLGLGLFRSGATLLEPSLPAEALLDRLLRAFILVVIFWSLSRLVDVAVMAIDRSAWMSDKPEVTALMPFAARIGRVVVLSLGVVTVLQEFGFTVTGLLAGMGLAGMAAALAGQKSIENLLGSATLLADRPFRVGDFVKVEDLVGTVEEVGLRSTRIRTLDRTLVTIPNGRLSEMRLETFAARDRIRLLAVLGLTYGTGPRILRRVIADLEEVLRSHPRVCDEPLRVRFVEFADSSLNLEVLAYIDTTDFAEFLTLRQEIYLRFMEVVEAAGSSFAFPTRTLHLEPAEISLAGSGPAVGSGG